MKTAKDIKNIIAKMKEAIKYYDECRWSKMYHRANNGRKALEWVLDIGDNPMLQLPYDADFRRKLEKDDLVVCISSPKGKQGVVQRVAKDGSWADVFWRGEYSTYDSCNRREKTTALERVQENE